MQCAPSTRIINSSSIPTSEIFCLPHCLYWWINFYKKKSTHYYDLLPILSNWSSEAISSSQYKYGCYQEWHQNTQNCTSLFWQIFTVYKIFTMGIKTKNLPRTTRFGLCFRCFIRWSSEQNSHLWVVPRVVVLDRLKTFTNHNVYFYNEHSLK